MAMKCNEKQCMRRILAHFLGRLSKLDSSGDEIGEQSTENAIHTHAHSVDAFLKYYSETRWVGVTCRKAGHDLNRLARDLNKEFYKCGFPATTLIARSSENTRPRRPRRRGASPNAPRTRQLAHFFTMASRGPKRLCSAGVSTDRNWPQKVPIVQMACMKQLPA
jgi:hypothetical protein